MKHINHKTVETRLSFAAAFSLPHPFVAFVLSESLGTRLVQLLLVLLDRYAMSIWKQDTKESEQVLAKNKG